MFGPDFGLAAAAAAALGGAAIGSVAREGCEEFVRRQKSKWSAANRPCQHPFDCEFHESLGMMRNMRYTTKDIEKHAKQASKWWHADKNGGVDRGFTDFQKIVGVLKIPRLRKLYLDRVDAEVEVAKDYGEQVSWRMLNARFLRELEAQSRVWTGTRDVGKKDIQSTAPPEICHVFLDASVSMRKVPTSTAGSTSKRSATGLNASQEGGALRTRIEKGKEVLAELFPRFVMTPTNIHLVGSRKGPRRSRCLVNHEEVLDYREQEVVESWSADAPETYLWHYIYEQTRDYKGSKHEIVIITDGIDKCSPAPFKGLLGFNELMTRLSGGKIRISLYLIGNSLAANDANSYRDLCLATGGFFHHDSGSDESDALQRPRFVVPLLLPEGERDHLAQYQQRQYQHNVQIGDAQRFGWYQPLPEREASGISKRGDHVRSSGSTTSLGQLQKSARVRLRDLQSSTELNGMVGTCKNWLTDQRRWEVKLDGCESTIALRPKNLQVLTGAGGFDSQHSYTEL